MSIGPVVGLPGSLLLAPVDEHPWPDPSLTHTLDVLRATAIRELHAHRGRGGVCVSCGAQWPCERARLAEHNLAVL